MKKIIVAILFAFIPFSINAYEINEDWNKIIGGESTEQFTDIVQTSDGGFVLVGYSLSQNINEITFNNVGVGGLIIKFDKNGNMQWYQIYEDQNAAIELNSVIEDHDNNLIVGGSVATNYNLNLIGGSIIIKYNQNGEMIWERKIENESSRVEDIIENNAGNYVVIGHINTDDKSAQAYIYEYDTEGNVIRNTEFGGSYDEYFLRILNTDDEGYIVAGDINSTDIPGFQIDSLEGLIMKYNKNLEIDWMNHWGGTSYDSFDSITKTPEGGYLVVAAAGNNTIEGIEIINRSDTVLVKFDNQGNVIEQKQVPFTLWNIESTKNGKYIGVGSCSRYNTNGETVIGENDAVIVVIDNNLNVEWKEEYKGDYDESFNAVAIYNNGFIAVGETNSTQIMEESTNGEKDGVLLTYLYDFEININESEEGKVTTEQIDDVVTLAIETSKGYAVDKVFVKDTNEQVIDVQKIKENLYAFNIYDDVNIEVIYKEEIINPKTGIGDVFTIIFIGFVVSLLGFLFVKNYNKRLEM